MQNDTCQRNRCVICDYIQMFDIIEICGPNFLTGNDFQDKIFVDFDYSVIEFTTAVVADAGCEIVCKRGSIDGRWLAWANLGG
jgi:hypothetical protein